jgi:hypothetical protein
MINDEIIKVVNDNLRKKSEFEFIAELEDLTLSDIDYIDKISTATNKFNLTYEIVDNIYIKIDYSLKTSY